MAESPPDIFLSYTRAQSRFVRAVADELSRQGVATCDMGDARDGPGVSWVDPVADTLAASDIVVVFIGAASDSPWQNFEIGMAVGGHKQVVPVYVTEDAISPADALLSMFESIDAHAQTPRQVADHIVRLIGVAA